MPAPARKAGLATRDPKRPRIRQSRDARRGRPSAAHADELGVALCHELGCDADADSRVTKVLADRLTCDAQQALRRCRSHSPSGHQPTPATLFPDGRNAEGLGAARLGSRETPPFRPFHKPGGGCTACRVAGGTEEPLLTRYIRSSKRRRQDAYATPRRRRTRTRSRRLSLRLRELFCSPARTARCRSSSISSVWLRAAACCSFENAEVELESDERELRDRIAWRSGRLAGRRRAYCSDSSLRNRRTVAPSGWVDVRRLCRPHKSARRSQVRPHAQSRLTHRPRTLAPSASQSVTDRLWPHRFR